MAFEDNAFKLKTIKFAKETIQFLNQNKITFFLDFGTLLGAVRENDLIDSDYDFDIGILHENHNSSLKNLASFCTVLRIQQGGKFVVNDFDVPTFYTLRQDDAMVDLYIYRKGMGLKFNGPSRFTVTGPHIYSHPVELTEEMKEIDFLGEKLYIPEKCEQYLEFIYGTNWRIPLSPKNTIHFNESKI